MTQPTIGRVVHYRLSAADVAAIDARSKSGADRNFVAEGQVHSATVTAVFGTGSSCNLVVQLDGLVQHWATSRPEGDEPGQWSWPARV